MARKHALLLRAAIGVAAFASPAWAVGLTQSDFDYLATQSVPRDSAVLGALSPKELSRLHAIIVDQTTSDNPAARAKNVAEAISDYWGHQVWEKDNPGKLWDSPKR